MSRHRERYISSDSFCFSSTVWADSDQDDEDEDDDTGDGDDGGNADDVEDLDAGEERDRNYEILRHDIQFEYGELIAFRQYINLTIAL